MKQHLRDLLEHRRFDEIAGLAAVRRRVLGVLVSLTYDARPLVAWRAVEAQGVAAERVAKGSPEYVRGHLRRLHWLVGDESGAYCTYAPPAMGEIVRRLYHLYPDYAGITASLLDSMAREDLEHFRPGILWAIGRMGRQAMEHIEPVLSLITDALQHDDPQTRGMAAWCLLEIGEGDLAGRTLDHDDGAVEIYRDGDIEVMPIHELTARLPGA